MVIVPYSFGRSVEMPGKHDSFGRSVGQIFGENGSPMPIARVGVPYSFGRSVEMTGKRDFYEIFLLTESTFFFKIGQLESTFFRKRHLPKECRQIYGEKWIQLRLPEGAD